MKTDLTAIRLTFVFLCLAVPMPVPADLFPQLSKRYPVGDPDAGNPLDPNREGPKSLAAGDLNGDGLADVVTANLDGSVSVLLGSESGLGAQKLFRAGGSIRAVTVADFNGDGHPDVAAADITAGVSVLLGNGDGTLEHPLKMPLNLARTLAAADFDRDGAMDLLVGLSPADCEQGTPGLRGVKLLPGKGDGTFNAPIDLVGLSTGCIYDVAAADLDSNGTTDAVILDYTSQHLLVYPGNGDGTFQSPFPLAVPGMGPRAFTLAYLDERLADGKIPPGATLDVVVANRDSSTVAVLLGLGGLRFAAPLSVPAGDTPRSAAAGDLDGDGYAELVVVNRNTNTLSVLRGLGDGRFTTPLEIAAGTSPREVVLADLSGDGALDAAAANLISGDVSFFTGRKGLAGFLVPEDYYPAGITPVGIVARDFDGDGLPDAATVNMRSHDVRVRLNIGGGEFGEEAVYPVHYQPSSMAAGDLNGDSHLDLAVVCLGGARYTSEDGGSLVVLLGQGDGTFRPVETPEPEGTRYRPFCLRLGDLSGDGILDAAVGGLGGEIVLYKGLGDGNFNPGRKLEMVPGRGRPVTLALGDADRDRRIDIITSHGSTLINNGLLFDESWMGRVIAFPVSSGDWVVEAGDLDGDGNIDLVVALTFVEPDPIAVHFGKGDGTFLDPVIYNTGMGVVSIKIADMDGDGILDILSGNRCTADVTILRGLGSRKFERMETVRTYSVESVDVADVNGDGRLDLVGAGLALWVVLSGGDPRLADPRHANPAGILASEGLYINEIMALNQSFYFDGEGRTPDWLELYNHSASPAVLGGWILNKHRRDGDVLGWTIPAGTTIGSMGHRVVFCDGKFGSPMALHSTYALDADGEAVSLVDPSGKTIDRVDFPALPKNVSYARFADGARYLCYNPVPTLGETNTRPTNMGPSVGVRNPVLPLSGDGLFLAARTFDDTGIASAVLRYRVGDQPEFTEIPLADDGAHADGRAGDGIFGALVPGLSPESTVKAYFRVVDLDGEVSSSSNDPSDALTLTRLITPPAVRTLRITELMAYNLSGIPGLVPSGVDWLEIANLGDAPASLDGLALAEDLFDPENLTAIPPGIILPAGGRLFFLCDGQSAGQIPPHALFRLSRSGGQIYLVRSGEIPRILDAIFYGPLPSDAAFGIPEGGGDPRILERPTPGTANSAATGLFVRGDPNDDGQRDLSDAIFILSFLYLGGPAPSCPASADIDDSDVLDLSDPIQLLTHLYLGGPAAPEPFTECGVDPTPASLKCEAGLDSCR